MLLKLAVKTPLPQEMGTLVAKKKNLQFADFAWGRRSRLIPAFLRPVAVGVDPWNPERANNYCGTLWWVAIPQVPGRGLDLIAGHRIEK